MSLINIRKSPTLSFWKEYIDESIAKDALIFRAFFSDVEAGLLLFNKKEKKVSFIFVLPKFRNLGIGSELVKHIDSKYEDKKNILYSSEMDGIQYLEKILIKQGWSKPEVAEHFFKISHSFLQDPKLDLISKTKMDIKPWRAEYLKLVSPNVPLPLKPDRSKYGPNSLALFNNNELIGWSLTTIYDHQQVVEYGKLFVKGQRGMGGILLLKSIAMQRDNHPMYNGYFKVSVEKKEMLDMIEKHFSKHLLQRYYFFHSEK